MKFDCERKNFNIRDTLECGQVFRFYKDGESYIVQSADKAAKVWEEGNKTVVESDFPDYFYNYFDLDRDYSPIIKTAQDTGIPLLARSAENCRGLKILNQNREEMIYSFIISQNNNIPRIKGIIERICQGLGEEFYLAGKRMYSFPSSQTLSNAGAPFFKSAGAGYRDTFLDETSKRISREGISELEKLDTAELKKTLLTYKGVGPKVADCVALFGFGKTDSFPVDTWIEKVYKEDFSGELKNREKISEFFVNKFGGYSGFIQQYLFYGKRAHL